MTQPLKYRPLSQRMISGLVAGLIVGLLVGILVAIRLAQINDSLYTPFLKAELRLHLAAIYGILMLIPGLIVGGLLLGRRKQVGVVAQGISLLLVLLIFYYGRNWLSYHIWAHFGGFRWLLEIVGILGWGFACWIFYKILLFLEESARGWTLGIALALVGLMLLWSGYYVVKTPEASSQEISRPALPAPKPNVKVALIGIDGAWWEMIDPLMKEGRMLVFQSLADRGVRSQCHTMIPTLSAPIWNTIATGKNPEKHHITAFTVWTFPITGAILPLTRIPVICYELEWMLGRIIQWTPINSTFRMSEAVWNILSDAGLKVGVMNWWASYPAEPVNGFIVSDHALYNKTLQYDLRGLSQGDPRSVFPPNLLPELEPLVLDPMSIPADSVARFIHFNTDADRQWYENTKDYRIFDEKSEAAMFKFSYPEDETMVRAALHLLKTQGQPDFFAIYLDGMDSMEHKYLPYYFHDRHPGIFLPENIERLKDLVPEYYMYMDQVVGELLAAMDPQTVVIVVSDHGFEHGLEPNLNYNHMHGPPGVFLMTGGMSRSLGAASTGNHIKQGAVITTASVRDITPTILNLFGLPIGKDMDGRVVTEAFDMVNMPINFIATYDYGDRQRGRIEPSKMDEAIQERLRALGYTK